MCAEPRPQLIEGQSFLLPACPDHLPERRVGLEDYGIPVGAFHADQHGCRLTPSRHDHPVFLGVIDALLDLLLEVTHCHCLHRISSVVRPGGFRRIAWT